MDNKDELVNIFSMINNHVKCKILKLNLEELIEIRDLLNSRIKKYETMI